MVINDFGSYAQVIEVIRHPTERAESGRGSGSGSAPADEEKYRELVKENEELQKQIAQVKSYFIFFLHLNWIPL